MPLRSLRRCLIIPIALTLSLVPHPTSAAESAPADKANESSKRAPTAGKEIVDGMRAAQARLKRSDSGDETRAIQKQAVDDLQKLIDLANRQSKGGSGRQNKANSQQNQDQQQQSESGQPQSGQAQPGMQPNGQAATSRPRQGRKSGEMKNSASPQAKNSHSSQALLREVWGHLPPAVRERVPADFSEAILPAYDELVRSYFESLLEDSNGSRTNSTDAKRTPEDRPLASPGASTPK